MHPVSRFIHQQGAVRNWHNIRHFIWRCTYDCLQSHLAQQTDALRDTVTVHFVERLGKYYQAHGVAKTRRIAGAIQLRKRG